MRFLALFLISNLFFFSSCKENTTEKKLTSGLYIAELEAQDAEIIPFVFNVTSGSTLEIYNADEVIEVDEILYKNDSVIIHLPVFESVLRAKIGKDNTLNGFYIKPNENKIVPFTARIGKERFETEKASAYNVSGNWEAVFSPENPEQHTMAKAIFSQENNKVTGTFRTTTGDYRYLEGVVEDNQLKLSTFDGAHAYLFTATVTDSVMQGMFYSGNHWKEPFSAKRNEQFELPDADTLTFLKEDYTGIEFSFPDATGKLVSLSDERFKNKVVIVQIMGTWCPNCLDETKYYTQYYNQNTDKPLEIVALAFEYAKSDTLAFKAINRLKERIQVPYPILLAQYGSSSKSKAQEKLPMLNQVLSYPTSIFIDKHGNVRKIHTGFNGPATGKKFIKFKTEFESFLAELYQDK